MQLGRNPDRTGLRRNADDAEVDDEGNQSTWGEHVTEEEYNPAPAA